MPKAMGFHIVIVYLYIASLISKLIPSAVLA